MFLTQEKMECILRVQVMHLELALFPSEDRHLCVFRRQRDERDPMKSPDTSVEMGNIGSVEIVFSSLLDESL